MHEVMPSHQEKLTALCLELVAIESVTGNETAITDYIEAWAKALGLPSDRQGNALIVGPQEDSRPIISLVGHTDTVPMTPDYKGSRVIGDTLEGLGSSDMKGSLAVMQYLAETMPLESQPLALQLIFYDKEEGPFKDNGLQPLLDARPALKNIALAIAMEPTDNTLQLGCVGGLQAKITFKGQAAHSARPWQGENAVHRAGRLLAYLEARAKKEHHHMVDVKGLSFRNAMSVTLAQGGRARNVVPDSFIMNLNYRFAPLANKTVAQLIANAKSEVHGLLESAGYTHAEQAAIVVDIEDVSPPGPVIVGNSHFKRLQETSGLTVKPKQAWTDVARLAVFGVEAINFGPGFGAQAHQEGEYISILEMHKAYEVLNTFFNTKVN